MKEEVVNGFYLYELCKDPQQFGILSIFKLDFGYINVNLIYFIFYCIFKVLQFLIEALIMLERNNRPKMESLVFSPTSANQDLMPNIIAVSYFSRNVTFT